MLLCDTHADTLYEMGVKKNPKPRVTVESLKKGGVSLQVLALWTGPNGGAGDVTAIIQQELEAFERLKSMGITQVHHPADVREGALHAMLSIEGGEVFEPGLHTIAHYANLGVVMAAVLWNHENRLGYPAKGKSRDGLTDYGLCVVREMQRLNMAVDVSHLNEQGFDDVFLKTNAPPCASHSCCHALCRHPRNLTDRQIRLLIQNGGYIGVNFYPPFLAYNGAAAMMDVVNHIDHVCQLGGENHIGFGSDFDGIELAPHGLQSPADFPALLRALSVRGYTDAAIARISGQNLLAYFTRIA